MTRRACLMSAISGRAGNFEPEMVLGVEGCVSNWEFWWFMLFVRTKEGLVPWKVMLTSRNG